MAEARKLSEQISTRSGMSEPILSSVPACNKPKDKTRHDKTLHNCVPRPTVPESAQRNVLDLCAGHAALPPKGAQHGATGRPQMLLRPLPLLPNRCPLYTSDAAHHLTS